jgi:hypothetical protein
VHVQRDEANAKFWLDSVRLDRSQRFPAQNLQASRNWWSVIKRNSGENGMITLAPNKTVLVENLRVTADTLVVDFDDGRSLSLPLAWYPRLQQGTEKERNMWRLNGAGQGIHWPLLDEDLSAEGLLAGRQSGESEASFNRWLKSRTKRRRS